MPRKTPDEIFTVIKKYEPDRQAEIKALQIVRNAGLKKRQEQQKRIKSDEADQKQAG
jgi:hypothetical protein